ncbi:hypothetical protein A6X20_21180 [Bradyrhizobium elkanii]|nr:hypothetical protein A6X20_21180 [Bradyrhizobium elkanii]ODM85274.1 hypothetical protein A6452_11575 [Bradyrhizobium elkanii]
MSNGFRPEQNRFRDRLANQLFELKQHFHRQEGITAAREEIIVERHRIGLEQPPPQHQQFCFQIQWSFGGAGHAHRHLLTRPPVEQFAQLSPLNLSRVFFWQLVEDQERNLE